ncbi:DNA repair exonuclease [Loigolactobacillus coryniformis]|uniref:Metallophosphoesterase n=1 Tax=Loigolactobacillus coryniformis subsp. coryniformis KCTC 3167 = DSM 20001 TaxID=913848 RepID=A0A0R1FI26_9LACO|nr:DNA repair exonuclease [Loigolactobacillus coryniformis]ATO55754.1 metallophosphoesterase [Loigolactobacillus coryniformis subsp. coryniformis KCTC 3167 = DSM 20001]KRK18866.1 metallophosphoesterase [Loigolactobacillus coryniformis subsp. coryniformis KCTC 3167 = DSM 20001]
MKFIHAADLHLDTPFLGLRTAPAALWQQIYDATFTAFAKIVDAALAEQVDFVCLVGDLYDRAERSIQAQLFLQKQLQRLADAAIPVYLSYGNHDYVSDAAAELPLPENTHIFPSTGATFTLTTKDGQSVALSGFSYAQRWVETDMTPQFPIKTNTDWHIGLLHGSQSGVTSAHAVYAPFTLTELNQKRYDYWALGHIHQHQLLQEQPPIVYAGNPQGRNPNEAGARGYYLVSQKGAQLQPEFHAVAPIQWQTCTVSVAGAVRLTTVINAIEQAVAKLKQPEALLLQVNLTAAETLSPALLQRIESGELLSYLQKQRQQQPWRWIYSLRPQMTATLNFNQLDQAYWQASAKKIFTAQNIAQVAQPLTQPDFLAAALQQADLPATLQAQVLNLLRENKALAGDSDAD